MTLNGISDLSLNTSIEKLSKDIKEQQADFADVKMFVADDDNNSGMDGFTKTATDAKNDFNSYKGVEKIDAIGDEIDKLTAQLEEYKAQLQDLLQQQERLNNELEKEKESYEALENQIKTENAQYAKIIDRINKCTEDIEDDIASQTKQATYDAMSKYNPDEDGEWEDFLADYMDGAGISSDLSASFNGLVKKSDFLSGDLKNLSTQLSGQARKVTTLNNQYNSVVTNISDMNNTISATDVAIQGLETQLSQAVKELIAPKEFALVDANNIDLTETLSDGSPRYIFAQGQHDNEFHIYDMQNGGASLARQYGSPGALRGSDLICPGNGYLHNLEEKDCATNDDSTAKRYFSLSSCGMMQVGRATYSTCSPLCFDINGDGVKTSTAVINYDIDGDGVIDRIYDSSDAVLVFDKDGDGISGKDGSECFGNNTDLDGDGKADGFKDGFEALKALAKKEGLIGDNDGTLSADDLKYLEKEYGLKIKMSGYNSQAQSLADVGITEIKLANTQKTKFQDNFDGNGNQLMTQEGAEFTVNGQTREYADIWHKKLDPSVPSSDEQNPFLALSEFNDTSSSVIAQIKQNEEKAHNANSNGDNIFKKLLKSEKND